ncbi:galacturonokinase [Cucumis melo]|uniref:Galacturonokinase n=1 Tax=Cucumis melo TaxID=3656 RepID=A0A1S4DZQ3_CUCME|nr:galacturonokinase [Cucumis melo]
MGKPSWPSEEELNGIKTIVSDMSKRSKEDVRVVVSPYRICPLGAHIDHQGGNVSAMAINKGVLLGFVPSGDVQVVLRSAQFKGDVNFRVDEKLYPNLCSNKKEGTNANGLAKLQEDNNWGRYARGAVYALQEKEHCLSQGIIGYICGSDGLDSSGLSSSAAVGLAYLLALENANNLTISPTDNIEYDRLIENGYLGLRNGILDQSAILLSSYGCLLHMNCKTKDFKLIRPLDMGNSLKSEKQKEYQILLAFSGLKQALTNNPGYNHRVAECQEAAKILLNASGNSHMEPLLCNVEQEAYKAHKSQLEPNLAKRAEHYFSENMRVLQGLEAWASGRLEDFGKLIAASGRSSIVNYECGAEPLVQLYEILLRAPGVCGARFSGAGFRGCCLAFVEVEYAAKAAEFVRTEYMKVQPELAAQINPKTAVMICEPGDCAHII